MGRTFDVIDARLARWIEGQPVFFVATVARAADGHINCSPKGNRGELRVVGPSSVAYLDQTGSGIETVAHLRDDGRIVLMLCAFSGPPRIVRLHGRGDVVVAGAVRFDELATRFPGAAGVGVRSIVVVEVERVADSCGYGVPNMRFEGHREQLDRWAERKGRAGIVTYWEEKNRRSIDGLAGLS
jgi:hypothetical protein